MEFIAHANSMFMSILPDYLYVARSNWGYADVSVPVSRWVGVVLVLIDSRAVIIVESAIQHCTMIIINYL